MNWISVKDKLPDSETFKVLCCFDEPFFGMIDKEIECAYYAPDLGYWVNDLTGRELLRVTHWMPLPNKPKI